MELDNNGRPIVGKQYGPSTQKHQVSGPTIGHKDASNIWSFMCVCCLATSVDIQSSFFLCCLQQTKKERMKKKSRVVYVYLSLPGSPLPKSTVEPERLNYGLGTTPWSLADKIDPPLHYIYGLILDIIFFFWGRKQHEAALRPQFRRTENGFFLSSLSALAALLIESQILDQPIENCGRFHLNLFSYLFFFLPIYSQLPQGRQR